MKKDWGKVWFELRAQKGQSDIATMMYKDTPEQNLTCAHFAHRESDGLGRIQKIIQQSGIHVSVKSKPLSPPAAWKNLFLTVKGLLLHPTANKNPWSYFVSKKSDPPEKVSYRTLTTAENNTIKTKAKELGVSPAFYLLSLLTDVVRKELFTDPEQPTYWLFPIDLRGAFPDAALDSLSISFLPVKINSSAATQIQSNYQKFKLDLKNQDYWAYHALYSIGQWIGYGGMKFIVDRTHEKSFWMGSFSDLGIWNQPELLNSSLKNRLWVIAQPGSPSYPIGFTTIEWCGQRTLTMRVHPSITNQDTVQMATRLLNQLLDQIMA